MITGNLICWLVVIAFLMGVSMAFFDGRFYIKEKILDLFMHISAFLLIFAAAVSAFEITMSFLK